MRQLTLLAALGLGLVVLTGCPPSYPNCKDDSTCQERGEVCVNGRCQECATDANCKDGFRCDPANNRCVPAAAAAPTTPATPATPAPREPGTCAGNEDCPGEQECQAGRCVAAAAGRCDWTPVQFGFNESNLTTDAQERLRQLADCLKGSQQRLTLAGHADERGTEEYNLQLSNRRAQSVKRYLTDLGVPEGRLETVGYGENRPANPASTEDAWSENRRVEFVR